MPGLAHVLLIVQSGVLMLAHLPRIFRSCAGAGALDCGLVIFRCGALGGAMGPSVWCVADLQ